MPSVFLDFVPPNDIPNLVSLYILEATTKDGPFNEIEEVTEIGTSGNYITTYTTENATSKTNWFAIFWEDDKGAQTPYSAAVQGGTRTLVAEIVSRVLLRDPSINEAIATQEAEAAISDYYGVLDPYSIDPETVPPNVISGMTYYTMARCYISSAVSTSTAATAGGKWVAGLVSLDTSSSSKATSIWDNIENLLRVANRELGRSYSIVALMEEITVAGGYRRVVGADLSRLIIEVA